MAFLPPSFHFSAVTYKWKNRQAAAPRVAAAWAGRQAEAQGTRASEFGGEGAGPRLAVCDRNQKQVQPSFSRRE